MTLRKNDDPKERLRQKILAAGEKLTASDKAIADHILRSYPRSLLQSASAIAKELDLNVSTVIRFFPKIGYKELREAQKDFQDELVFLINSPLDRLRRPQSPGDGTLSFHEAIALERQNIDKTIAQMKVEDMTVLQGFLISPESHLFIWGTRKEYALAYYLFIQLNAIRDKVHLLQPQGVVDTLSHAETNAVLLLFDFRRYPKMNHLVARHIKERGGKIVLFTDSTLAPCSEFADCSFLVETRGSSAFDSYTAGMVLINIVLAEALKSLEKQFHQRQKDSDLFCQAIDYYEWQQNRK